MGDMTDYTNDCGDSLMEDRPHEMGMGIKRCDYCSQKDTDTVPQGAPFHAEWNTEENTIDRLTRERDAWEAQANWWKGRADALRNVLDSEGGDS